MRSLRLMLLLAVAGSAGAADNDQARLLRYPDISATQIAFVHGGDIYIVAREGGTAQRLTSHEGQELYPKFSPDGRWIAFSAEYSGTRQVYVIPAAGGTPRQLTFYTDIGELPPRGGTDYRVLDWTPDGQQILVRMNRMPYDDRGGKPYLVPFAGGMEKPLAVPETGGGSLSPDGQKYVYTPIDADWRGWKRYRGGRAPDIWIYDLAHDTSTRLTDFKGMDMQPSWVGDRIYFASDRGTTLNLYAIAPTGGEPTQLTQFKDFDVLWPSGGPDAVVFEQGGYLWRYDVSAGAATQVPIRLIDDAPGVMPQWKKVGDVAESFGLSPGGERAVIGARGEIFTVPAKNGEARNVSRTPEAREISVAWSPDGQWLSYLSDATGEYEIYVRRQDGSGEPRRLTTDGDVWRFPPVWSPDSKKLAFADKKVRLRWVDIASGKGHEVDASSIEDITEYEWSPDSRWIAYSKTGANRLQSIWLHDIDSGRSRQLTHSTANESSPSFDPKGRYLYFLSNRDFSGLTFSSFEFNYLYTNGTRVYAAALSDAGPVLYPQKSDEVAPAAAASEDKKKDDAKDGAAKPAALDIDFDGFDARVVAMHAPPGNYAGLSANANGVFFVESQAQGPGKLKFLALDADEPKDVIGGGVTGYGLSRNGEKVLVRVGKDFAIVDAKPDQDVGKNKLALDRVELLVDPRVENRQMAIDAWRILRDWFYDENVHGGRERWNAIRDRYLPLVAHVATRQDLDYVLHEIAGEANAGHVYVQAGDQTRVARKPGGLLGAEFEADGSGYFRISKLFAGENWNPETRSPLTETGVGAQVGDYVIAIDGVDTRTVKNIYELLQNKADRQISVRLNGKPSATGAREVLVKTIGNELGLRYIDWVASRRALVDKLSGGRIGYIHVPNTAVEGNREVNRWLPAMAHKEALIIDDRYNGGGFIPDRLVELLARQPLNYWKRRGLDPQPTPAIAHVGPKAMLINGFSSSGGDALPYYFRELKLGTLIGTRTWGGLIGISGNPSLADGGVILAATFRFLATNGQWAVENEGVAPDIEVIDRPELIAGGRDPSIEKAVEVLLGQLREQPVKRVTAPAPPSQFGE